MVLTCGLRCNYQSRPSEARENWVYCQMVEMAFFEPFGSPYRWTYQLGSPIQNLIMNCITEPPKKHVTLPHPGWGSIPTFLGWTQYDIENWLRQDVTYVIHAVTNYKGYAIRDTFETSQISEENKVQTTSWYLIYGNSRYPYSEIVRKWGNILGHNYSNSRGFLGQTWLKSTLHNGLTWAIRG